LFLEFSAGEAGGLLINGNPGDRSVSLRLLPAGGEVRFADLEAVLLPWNACGQVRSVMEGPERDGWAITHWRENSREVSGVGVQVSGVCSTMVAAISRATTSRLHRRFGSRELTGHSLPLLRTKSVFTPRKPERETLQALTTVLTARPKARALLADSARMQRLAADLSTGLRTRAVDSAAILRDATDIEVALRQCGYLHEFGRPIEGESLPSLDKVVGAVRERLTANPHRVGRTVDETKIAEFARHHYLDLEPWPFAALVT
jgi:hypothetical protein